jgi:polyisoprenoid-binding protein YceI
VFVLAAGKAGTGAALGNPVQTTIGFWVRHLMVSKVRGTFKTDGAHRSARLTPVTINRAAAWA